MASVFEVFEDSVFGLVLLDEASQLMEPLTLVPLVRFRTSRLILVGDPLQVDDTVDLFLRSKLTLSEPTVTTDIDDPFRGR